MLLMLAAVALTVTVLLWSIRTGDPSYGGKKLSEWLQTVHWDDNAKPILDPDAVDALRHMGPSAYPRLVQMAAANPPRPGGFGARLAGLLAPEFNNAEIQNMAAKAAFRGLGQEAKGASPLLLKRLRGFKPSAKVLMCLAYVDPTSAAAEVSNLEDRLQSRCEFIQDLGRSTGNYPQVVPLLVQCLRWRDPDSRLQATEYVGVAAISDRSVPAAVPALAGCLKDPDYRVRLKAAEALKFYGDAAKPAIPALMSALSDPDEHFHIDVTVAIKAIDPAVLTSLSTNRSVQTQTP